MVGKICVELNKKVKAFSVIQVMNRRSIGRVCPKNCKQL
jgi:hypothetical protein